MTEKNIRWISDFLLLFNHVETYPRARAGATWATELETPGFHLLVSSPTSDWRGSPLTRWQEKDFSYWLIGELWGEFTSSDPVNWPGHFVLLGYESNTHRWHLWTNRCGTFHAYYGNGTHGSALSTFSNAAACVTDRDLDVPGIAGFFSFGFFPSDHTYFKDVSIIRPSTHLVLDQDGKIIKQERAWEWFHEPDPTLTFDQAVDRFAVLFHKVINEQMKDRHVAFPISGGLDSRSTVAALPKEGPESKPWSFSYGYDNDSIETRIAGKIAQVRNLPHSKFTIQPYLFEKMPMVMDSVEGFQDVTQCRQAYITGELADHADYVMAAHWGDVWLDDMGCASHPGVNWLEYAYGKFQKNGNWLINNIVQALSPGFDTPVFLRDTLASEAARLVHLADPDVRLKVLKTELWSFRWTTASLRMYQPGAFPLLPFYDPRLVNYFCTIPTEFVTDRRLQIEYLKRYAPDLARITWQPYDANLFWFKRTRDLLIPKRALKKATRVMMRQPLIQRNWEVQFLSPGGRQAFEHILLKKEKKLHTFVLSSKLEKLIRDFYTNPSPANGYTVSMLLTFTNWLDIYA